MTPRRTKAEIVASQAAHKAALTARILVRVESAALSSDDIAVLLNTPKSTVRQLMMSMMHAGSVHRRRDQRDVKVRKVRWYIGAGPEMVAHDVSKPSQTTFKTYPQDYPAREPLLAAFFGGWSERRA